MAPKKTNIAQKARSDKGRTSTSNSKSKDPLLDGMFSQLERPVSCFSYHFLPDPSSFHKMRAKKIRSALWQALASFATSTGCGKFFRNFHSNNPKDPKRFGRWGLHLPHPHPSQLKLMWRCKPKDLGGPQVAHPNPTTLAERRYCMAWYGSGRNIL